MVCDAPSVTEEFDPDEIDDVGSICTPTIDMDDDELEATVVEYSDRAPEDFVISGPLLNRGGRGPGRAFLTIAGAVKWAVNKYGARLKGRVTEAEAGGRWAFLIRGEKR